MTPVFGLNNWLNVTSFTETENPGRGRVFCGVGRVVVGSSF